MKTLATFLAVITATGLAQEAPQTVPLVVPAGVPLRLYLTKRIPKRLNAPVEAKTLVPLYAFDREVVPTGTVALGSVVRLDNVGRMVRAQALLGGDLTPLHEAEVRFTSLRLPDGRVIPIDTVEGSGLRSIFPIHPPKPKSAATANGGMLARGKETMRESIHTKLETMRSIPEMVRAPGKKEMLADFLWAKLPYHPQFVPSRTRFDAELTKPLDFGLAQLPPEELGHLGSQPSADIVVHARLTEALDSKNAANGQHVRAVLEQPLFSETHQLILPEGTGLEGAVVMAKKAGWFHHAGRLRFTFETVQMPPEAVALRPDLPILRTMASLRSAETGGAPVKFDGEGGVQAKDSNMRFLAPFLSAIAAGSGSDDDDRSSNGSTSHNGNRGGRAVSGGSGFGLFGTIAAQLSPQVSSALGYYGLARSVYFNVIARGAEAEFKKNAAVDIGFNARPAGVAAPPEPAFTK